MTTRERIKAIFNYEKPDRLPLIHFSYWYETLDLWAKQGYISKEIAKEFRGDGSPAEKELDKIIGWDQSYGINFAFYNPDLFPNFEEKKIREVEGGYHYQNYYGVIEFRSKDAGSIPAEIEHILVDRKSWEEFYLPKLQWSEDRYYANEEGIKTAKDPNRASWLNLQFGSLIGTIRNWLGVVGLSYLTADDPDLLKEIVDTFFNLQYKCMEKSLEICDNFDSISIWEDICYDKGTLVSPKTFEKYCGEHYRKVSELAKSHGINFCHVDCDGFTEQITKTWVNNGINVMFPIEVGKWGGSYKAHRDTFGKSVLGVGGMNKTVFSMDKKAIDKEIERLKPIIELGGFIPCPDHRIAPDAKFENVCYYVEQLRKL